MKKVPVEVQKRYNNMKKEIKNMITDMRMARGYSKINTKRSASHMVKKTCYSGIRTFRTYVFVSVMYDRKKQKDMILRGEISCGDLDQKQGLYPSMYKYSAHLTLSEKR